MNRRYVAILACLLVVVVAGCNTGSDDETGSTVTAAEVPEVTGATGPAATPTPATTTATGETPAVEVALEPRTARPGASVYGVSFPPGTDRRGVLDADALLRAHETAAADGGYVLVVTRTVRTAAGETIEAERSVFRVTAGGPIGVRTRRLVADGREVNRSTAAYLNGSEVFVRRVRGGNVTYDHTTGRPAAERRGAIAAVQLRRHFDGDHWRFADLTTVDGRVALAFAFDPPAAEVVDAHGRLVVTEAGRVHVLQRRIRSRTGGRERVRQFTYALRPRSTLTVAPPEWLDRARNRTESGRPGASDSGPSG